MLFLVKAQDINILHWPAVCCSFLEMALATNYGGYKSRERGHVNTNGNKTISVVVYGIWAIKCIVIIKYLQFCVFDFTLGYRFF